MFWHLLRIGSLVSMGILSNGCGSASEAHPVTGQLQGAPAELAGHLIEVSRDSDPNTRGFGTLDAQGTFRLERLTDGRLERGVPAGSYRARLVLNDEGDGKTKRPPVPRRYLEFQTSGWTLQVPAAQTVTLNYQGK